MIWSSSIENMKFFKYSRTIHFESPMHIPRWPYNIDPLWKLIFAKENIPWTHGTQVQKTFHSTVVLDPGVSVFHTIYDLDGRGIKWGHLRNYHEKQIDIIQETLIHFLCENYRCVLIPSFRSKYWDHSRFLKRLIEKQKRYPDCLVIIVDESYSTKTCSHCGIYSSEIRFSSKRIFQCPYCSFQSDRDLNACRNILFQYINT